MLAAPLPQPAAQPPAAESPHVEDAAAAVRAAWHGPWRHASQRVLGLVERHVVPHVNHWLGQTLARRFLTVSLGLLLVIQLTSFLVIEHSMYRHAMKALPEHLAMGTRTVQSLIDWRAEKLIEGARLLAADYGFRSAVLSRDRATIASVLANHGARIGASEATLLGPDFSTLAIAEGSAWDGQGMSIVTARLAQQAAGRGSATEIAVIGGQPRQVVLVPMKAPMLVGWVLMCFPVPMSIADDVHKLSAADLTLLARERPDRPWTVALSRLPPAAAADLARRPWVDRRDTAAANGVIDSVEMLSLRIQSRDYGVRALWLNASGIGVAATPSASSPPASPAPQVLALMSVSVDEALKPPDDLRLSLLLTTLLGFVSFGLAGAFSARRVATPLQSLAAAAERLGSGDYATPVRIAAAHGEVEHLADTFEKMRQSVARKQEQIVQSEKLASIGQLAAGVAHEINNPIGFVFSNFGSLEEYLGKLFRMLDAYREAEADLAGKPAALKLQRLREEIELEYLQEDIPALMSESKDGIRRVRKIVQDLKDFSHVDARREWETVDLHVGLDSTLNIANNEIKYKADVVKEYGVLPAIECLPNELNQVFMNLMMNAAQAMTGPERGTLVLRTGTGVGATGDEVWVEVQDNGSGIAPGDLKRIFDPFFTTKPVGKGTGLGLSLSYGIVKTHGGRIEVTSEVGKGTTFRVTLPVKRPADSE